jgi:uncharacterized protein (TIGR02679 family)
MSSASPVDLPRLRRLLGPPELRWLVSRMRRRLERAEPLTGTVRHSDPSPGERDAVERLLGRPPQLGRSLSVSLPAVDAVLRRSGISPDGLAPAVVALTGEITDRGEEARRTADAWRSAFEPLAELCARRPELSGWHERIRDRGLVRRLTGNSPGTAAGLLSELTAVLHGLPASGTDLGVYASRVCGDAHALDDDRPLTTLALGAVCALRGVPLPAGAEERREAWASVGLLRDELSSTVLALGLPGDAVTPTGRALAALRDAGQPAVLTLRQVVRSPARPLTATVHVCENPSVVSAAAERLRDACPPLVCTQGQPGSAAVTLLRQLAGAGCGLRYHGDFDWGGLRIAGTLLRRVTWRPWRYTAAAYREAAATAPARTPRLTGTPATSDWDPALSPAMAELGLRVEEEMVLDELLDDLAAS